MFCQYCGTENDARQYACRNCGQPLRRTTNQPPGQQFPHTQQARAGLSPAMAPAGKEPFFLFRLFGGCLGRIIALALVIGGFIGIWILSRPLEGQAPVVSLVGHTNLVEAAIWSPDGTRIASGSNDGTVRVWDASTGRQLVLYRGYPLYANGLSWSPDSKQIASIGKDMAIHIWNASNGGNERVIQLKPQPAYLAWSPDGTHLAVATGNLIQIVDSAGGQTVYTFREHTSSVYQIQWSPDGKRIASGSADKTVRVWDQEGKTPTRVYREHTNTTKYLSWSPDGTRIASVDIDRTRYGYDTARIWEVANLHTLYSYKPDMPFDINGIAWSPDGKHIAVSMNHDLLQVWNAANNSSIFNYRGASRWGVYHYNALSWSPDSSRLVAASSDNTLIIIEPRDNFIGQASVSDLIDMGIVGAGMLLFIYVLQIPKWGQRTQLRHIGGATLLVILVVGALMALTIVSGWNPWLLYMSRG